METRTDQKKGSDIVLELLHALEEKDYDRAARFLTNGFTFSGATPRAMNREECIELHRHLSQAIPDWRFNFTVVEEDENEITCRGHITGTHTRDLTLPMIPNLGTVQATGKKISLPRSKVQFYLKDNKVSRWSVESVPLGGLMGLLEQVGVDAHELAR